MLARSGDWRVWLLNAEAACLWDWYQDGLNVAALSDRLTRQAGLNPASARRQVESLIGDWRLSGLLEENAPNDSAESDWSSLPATGNHSPWPADTMGLAIGDVSLGLWVETDQVHQAIWPSLAALPSIGDARTGPLLGLYGPVEDWTLQWDRKLVETGRGPETILPAVLREITEYACRAAERLLVVHGAGLIGPDGAGVLLIAPGGSGKTTLAAALNAEGLPLLHDDVVPVDLKGRLLGLGLPITLKAGSWPVLQTLRPDLSETPVCQRLGQPVRLLPPRPPGPTAPVPLGTLVFPRYQPSGPAHVQRLSPEAALQGLIEAEAVIRQLTQDKLERLARWIESATAWSVTYPDIDTGLAAVRAAMAGHSRL